MTKSLGGLKERIHRIWAGAEARHARWVRFVLYPIRLVRFSLLRLRHNNAMAMSAALSFRTIFALVPTLVLMFLFLKALGTLETKALLDNVLQRAGLSQIVLEHRGDDPAAGEPDRSAETRPPVQRIRLADQLQKLIAAVEKKLTLGRIGPIGALLLIWAAVTLLTTVERSLNRIFEAPRSRSLGRRVLLYWSAVTFVPLALTAADYLAGRAVTFVQYVPVLAWLLATVSWAGSFVLAVLVLAGVYSLMPNTIVRFRSAAAGAVVAVPLWGLARWGFASYISLIVRNHSLYGALGLIPLFLIWLNLCWTIFLLGAQVAFTVANMRRLTSAEAAERLLLGPWDAFAAALAVAREYLAGRGPVTAQHVAKRLNLPEEPVGWLLQQLAGAGVLCATARADGEAYVLARPPEKIEVLEIMDLPSNDRNRDRARYDEDLRRVVDELRHKAGAALKSTTLAQAAAIDRQKA